MKYLIFCLSIIFGAASAYAVDGEILSEPTFQQPKMDLCLQDDQGNFYEVSSDPAANKISGTISTNELEECQDGEFEGWYQGNSVGGIWFEFAGSIEVCCPYFATYGSYDLFSKDGSMNWVCDHNNDGEVDFEGETKLWEVPCLD